MCVAFTVSFPTMSIRLFFKRYAAWELMIFPTEMPTYSLPGTRSPPESTNREAMAASELVMLTDTSLFFAAAFGP